MAAYKQLSSLYLRLRNKVGEGTLAGDIIDDVRINSSTPFKLLAKLNNRLTVSAQDISYQMGMYAPDHFTAELTVSMSENHAINLWRDENDNQITLIRIAKALQGLRAEVRYIDESGADKDLSKNLFVYQATPSIDRNAGASSVSITLQIYSVDKLLELQKFSQAFTGMPLGNIITDENMKPFFPSKNGSTQYEFQTQTNLQVLGYRHKNGKDCELIQSYLAQYNETFRELLNRTANRCGEFLYWRDGKLQYGLAKDDKASVNVDNDAARITVPELPTTDFEALKVVETHRNGNEAPEITTEVDSVKADEKGHTLDVINSKVAPSANDVRFDQETGMPDFNDTVNYVYGNKRLYDYQRLLQMGKGNVYYTDTTNAKYGKKNEAKSDVLKYWIGKFLSKFASSGGLMEFLTGIAVDTVITMPSARFELEKFRDVLDQGSHNKRFASLRAGDMQGFNKEEQTNIKFDNQGNVVVKASRAEDYDKVNSVNKIAPFSTIRDVVDPNNAFLRSDMLGNSFYTRVRKLGETAAKNAVDITMTPNAKPLNVGQRILLNGVEYVVTSITGSIAQADIDGYSANGTIVTSQKVHAIPQSEIKENVYFYMPEPLKDQNRKMDGNCTAYITDIEDPYKEGRVRVRFTWQGARPSVASTKVDTAEEDSTPWIRMTLPAAGNAITYMKPSIGDEVIVAFENGNLERPYVIGSVFNKTNNIPATAPLTASNSGCYYLKMPNGEGISIVDENISPSDVFSQFVSPLVGSVMKLADMDYMNAFHQLKMKVGGKIEMKDKYGFYNLSMSSAERAVKIACPMGDISLSAFTGINISAPNGDININGKNVNITAGDKITLTSGTNKRIFESKTPGRDIAGSLMKMVAKAAVSAANVMMGDIRLVDLSLARSITEVIFRPINGTLSLHSCHHLLIEAGYGNVEMPLDTLATKSAKIAVNTIPNYPYYLLENFVDGIEGDFQNGVVALQHVYDWIRNYTPRENDNVDNYEHGDVPGDIYFDARESLLANSALSKNKFNQILKKGTKKKGELWVVDDSESTINSFCPIHKDKRKTAIYVQWVAEVKKVAQKVADLQNIHEAIVNKKITDMPALKSFVDAMRMARFNNNSGLASFIKANWINESDFSELSGFASEVKYDEKTGRNNVAFDIANFVGGNVTFDSYKPITFKGSFLEDHRHLIQFTVLKALHKVGAIKYIDKGEKIVYGQKKYTLSEFPAWNNGEPDGFKTWNEFLSHCAPADSVSEKSLLKSIGSSLAKSGLATIDTITNSFDLYNQAAIINDAFSNDRKVWNTASHPGMILMSSDFGSRTAVVDSTGQIVANNNHSVYSVLDNMKQQEALPPVANREDSVQAAFEKDWTQTFNV